MPRVRLDTDARRAQLLQVGRALFAERPYDAVSTGDITAAAGISQGLLFHYFRNKRGFYLATLTSVAEDLLAATAPAPGAPFHDAVRDALWAYLAYARDHRALYTALARGGVGSDAEGAAIVQGVRDESLRRMLEVLGATPDAATRLRLAGWLGLVEHGALAWLDHGGATLEALHAHQLAMLTEVLR